MTRLYEPISEESIIDGINDTCDTTNESYSNKKKIKNINGGLDKYWFLAAESAPRGTLDDTSNSAPPVETPNLVSGTNNYKIGSLTNKILQILKVSVLDSNGVEYDLEYEDFSTIPDFTQTYSATLTTGLPFKWTKYGDFIYVNPTPDYSYTAGLRIYPNRELSKFSYVEATMTIATPGVVTAVAHGLVNDDVIILITDGALPTGLTADTTAYYVTKVDADTFKLSTTLSDVGVTYITTSGTQSGTHKFVKVNTEPGIPVIHHDFLIRYASYQFMDAAHPKFAKLREQLAIDQRDIQDYWQSAIRENETIIKTSNRRFK